MAMTISQNQVGAINNRRSFSIIDQAKILTGDTDDSNSEIIEAAKNYSLGGFNEQGPITRKMVSFALNNYGPDTGLSVEDQSVLVSLGRLLTGDRSAQKGSRVHGKASAILKKLVGSSSVRSATEKVDHTGNGSGSGKPVKTYNSSDYYGYTAKSEEGDEVISDGTVGSGSLETIVQEELTSNVAADSPSNPADDADPTTEESQFSGQGTTLSLDQQFRASAAYSAAFRTWSSSRGNRGA